MQLKKSKNSLRQSNLKKQLILKPSFFSKIMFSEFSSIVFLLFRAITYELRLPNFLVMFDFFDRLSFN